jgi:hypothetical protein
LNPKPLPPVSWKATLGLFLRKILWLLTQVVVVVVVAVAAVVVVVVVVVAVVVVAAITLESSKLACSPAVFPKTDSSKRAHVYCTIDIASLAVTSFSFPLIEVSKPVFALPSSDGKLLTKCF